MCTIVILSSEINTNCLTHLGFRTHLTAHKAFGFLMLKYAFSHILETLFLLFLTSSSTLNADKNSIFDGT